MSVASSSEQRAAAKDRNVDSVEGRLTVQACRWEEGEGVVFQQRRRGRRADKEGAGSWEEAKREAGEGPREEGEAACHFPGRRRAEGEEAAGERKEGRVVREKGHGTQHKLVSLPQVGEDSPTVFEQVSKARPLMMNKTKTGESSAMLTPSVPSTIPVEPPKKNEEPKEEKRQDWSREKVCDEGERDRAGCGSRSPAAGAHEEAHGAEARRDA